MPAQTHEICAHYLARARIQTDIKTILIVTKPGDVRLIKLTRELASYLIITPRYGKDHGATVYVDECLKNKKRFGYEALLLDSPFIRDNLKFWTPELCKSNSDIFNFVITV